FLPTSTRDDAPAPPPAPRWQTVIGDAVASAAISVGAAEIIRTRLTAAADAATEHDLTMAARALIAAAPEMTLENLAALAARTRDELDAAGIPARENALHAKRYLKFRKQPDGS